MRAKLHVRRGDVVAVTVGSSRGTRGRVLRTMPSQSKVVVEGINLVWKHLRRSRQHPRGGRIQREAPIHASNVQLICTNRECARFDKPVRTARTERPDGTRVRVCTKCRVEIARPE